MLRPLEANHTKLWNFETDFTPLMKLKKIPDEHVSTREEARVSRPHPEEPRFRLTAGCRYPFHASAGKNSRQSSSISRGDAVHRKEERNSWVLLPFQESARCLSPFHRNLYFLHCLDFHAMDRLKPRRPMAQPCGKASWESLLWHDPGVHLAFPVESASS